MVNRLSPPSIIFVNADLTTGVRSVLERQLFIQETIDKTEFDSRIEWDPMYPDAIKGNSDLRILVLVPALYNDTTNREYADLVLFIKQGIASILSSKYGPPGISYPLDRCYLSQFMRT